MQAGRSKGLPVEYLHKATTRVPMNTRPYLHAARNNRWNKLKHIVSHSTLRRTQPVEYELPLLQRTV
jgi:hypothetical protein